MTFNALDKFARRLELRLPNTVLEIGQTLRYQPEGASVSMTAQRDTGGDIQLLLVCQKNCVQLVFEGGCSDILHRVCDATDHWSCQLRDVEMCLDDSNSCGDHIQNDMETPSSDEVKFMSTGLRQSTNCNSSTEVMQLSRLEQNSIQTRPSIKQCERRNSLVQSSDQKNSPSKHTLRTHTSNVNVVRHSEIVPVSHNDPSCVSTDPVSHDDPSWVSTDPVSHDDPSCVSTDPVSHDDPSCVSTDPVSHDDPSWVSTDPVSHDDPSCVSTDPVSHDDPSWVSTDPVSHDDPSCVSTDPVSHDDPSWVSTDPVSHDDPSCGSTVPVSHDDPSCGSTVPVSHDDPSCGSTVPVSHDDPSCGSTIPVSRDDPSCGKRGTVEEQLQLECTCRKAFTNKASYRRHWKYCCSANQSRQEYVYCNICSAGFANNDSFKSHYIQHVQGQRSYVCDRCGKSYKTRTGLLQHNRRVHNVAKVHPVSYKVCPVCSKSFFLASGLTRHMTTHSEAITDQCEICGKGFKQRDRLQRHIRTVHFNQYYFNCGKCGHGLDSKKELQNHVCGRVMRKASGGGQQSSTSKARKLLSKPEKSLLDKQTKKSTCKDRSLLS